MEGGEKQRECDGGHEVREVSQDSERLPLHTKGLPNRTLLFLNYFRKLPNIIFLEFIRLGNLCEQWITESLGLPYRIALGIKFGNICGRIAELKSFWN